MPSTQDNTSRWNDRATSDVTLICEGREFPCHREVLASASDYFRTLFFGRFAESNAPAVELFEDDLAALERLLRALYGHPVESALAFYYAIPGVSDVMDPSSYSPADGGGDDDDDDDHDGDDGTPSPSRPPPTRGQALRDWIRDAVALYAVASKYLCEGVRDVLMGGNHLPWALEGLLWDFFAASSAAGARPGVEEVRAVLAPVYECVVDPRDPLRIQIADAVASYQREEDEGSSDGEDERRAPGLLAALPDLEADLATVGLEFQDSTVRAKSNVRRREVFESVVEKR